MWIRTSVAIGFLLIGFVGAAIFDSYQATTVSGVNPVVLNPGAPYCNTQPKAAALKSFFRFAQAQSSGQLPKTELGPFGWLKPSAEAVAAADADPALIEGLGSVHYPIGVSDPLVQKYFDQGLRLSYAFNHAEALRAFRKARTLDPNCAMCYWGEALVQGPNINAPMDNAAVAPARTAIKHAKSLARSGNAKDRALIDALDKRYKRKGANDKAYAAAMRTVAQKFPDDDEIATLYAEALMTAQPWEYWNAAGTEPKGHTAEIVALLEKILARSPNHPGAIHFYIHITEASADVKRAVPHAQRLGMLTPAAGHLVHMPFHTFFRVGMYKEAIDSNRKAVLADEAYIARAAPVGMYPMGYYPHNVHSLMVSAQMAGDAPTVIQSADKLGHIVADDLVRTLPFLQPVKAAPYFAHAQFSNAPTILSLPKPNADLPYVTAMWHYARGVGFAHSGDANAALAEADAIAKLAQSTELGSLEQSGVPAASLLRLADHVVRARVAQQRGDLADAVRHFEAAVKEEDSLSYSEPAYWYFPVRQSLGATLILSGDLQKAEGVLTDSLMRTPNNGWALYALAMLYDKRGDAVQARAARELLNNAWLGEPAALDLARL